MMRDKQERTQLTGFQDEPLVSNDERESIIQDLISTQMLAGIEVSYEAAAKAFDEAYRLPMPILDINANQ